MGLATNEDMLGKVCMVTGATAGIGKAAATALAAQRAEVIVIGRNQQKTRNTVHQIISKTGNESVHYLLAEFSDLQQVRELAATFKKRFDRLDVLINNAGTYYLTHQETPYGVEKVFLVNHLAPFLLTNLLIENIRSSAPARIVNVSSDSHYFGTPDFDDGGLVRSKFGMKAYARSKLANVLFTYELARRMNGAGVTVNAVHPGHIATDIYKRNFPVIGPVIKFIAGLFAQSPEIGADALVYLATSPEVEGITGKYFDQRKEVPSSQLSYDPIIAEQLWKLSEEYTASLLPDGYHPNPE